MSTDGYGEAIRCLLNRGFTPMETAEACGLSFLRVTNYMDKHGLGPHRFFIAVKVHKARKYDEYWAPHAAD